jgi:hypothetical protein
MACDAILCFQPQGSNSLRGGLIGGDCWRIVVRGNHRGDEFTMQQQVNELGIFQTDPSTLLCH